MTSSNKRVVPSPEDVTDKFPFCEPLPGEIVAVPEYPTPTPMPELWSDGLRKLETACGDDHPWSLVEVQDGVQKYYWPNAPKGGGIRPQDASQDAGTAPMSKGVGIIEDCVSFDLTYALMSASMRYRWDKTLQYLRPIAKFNPYAATYYCVLDMAKKFLAPRDFYLLTHLFYNEKERAVYVLHCSIPENQPFPSMSSEFVRGSLFAGWRLAQAGKNVQVTYVSQMDLDLASNPVAKGVLVDMPMQIARLRDQFAELGFGPYTLNPTQPGYIEHLYCMADPSLDGSDLEFFYRVVMRPSAGSVVKIRFSRRMYSDGVNVHIYGGASVDIAEDYECLVLRFTSAVTDPIAVLLTTKKPHVFSKENAEAARLEGYLTALAADGRM